MNIEQSIVRSEQPGSSTDSFGPISEQLVEQILFHPPTILPSLEMIRLIGAPDEKTFITSMARITATLVQTCRLSRDAKVLDLGCGVGRIALGLTRYLNNSAQYLGTDIWKTGIDWCCENITPIYTNFRFVHTPGADNYYHGRIEDGENNFEGELNLQEDHFDMIIAISLFSHLKEVDAMQYLRMISRALKPNGLGYLTFFMIDDEFHQFVGRTGRHKAVKHFAKGVWHAYDKAKFFAGFERGKIINMTTDARLEIVEIKPGRWAEKLNASQHQDLLLVKKS